MWNLHLPNKIKIHFWRLLFDALPVRTNLARRGIYVDISCPICHVFLENIVHAFWYCSSARQVWKLTAIWQNIKVFGRGSFCDLFCHIIDFGSLDDLRIFVINCWSIWRARNQCVFNGIIETPSDIVARSERVGFNFCITSACSPVRGPIQSHFSSWQPPAQGRLKINVDAAVSSSRDWFSIGIVGRDSVGHVLFAQGKYLPGMFPPQLAEILAVNLGLEKALSSSGDFWEIESDASNVIDAIKQPAPYSMVEPIAAAIRRNSSICSIKG